MTVKKWTIALMMPFYASIAFSSSQLPSGNTMPSLDGATTPAPTPSPSATPIPDGVTPTPSTKNPASLDLTPAIGVSEKVKADRQRIKSQIEKLAQERKKAESLKDNDSLTLLDNLDKYLQIQAVCLNKDDDIDVDVCFLTGLKKLANDGNFVAQHNLGKLFEKSYGNKPLAQMWYEKALANPKTPEAYKIEIKRDSDALK